MVALGVEPEAALQRPATLAPRFGGVAVGAHLLVDLARALQDAHVLRDGPSCPAQSGMGALSSMLLLTSCGCWRPVWYRDMRPLWMPPCLCHCPPAAARRSCSRPCAAKRGSLLYPPGRVAPALLCTCAATRATRQDEQSRCSLLRARARICSPRRISSSPGRQKF